MTDLSFLNEKQLLVAGELERNVLLLASAGTGKTNTLSCRIGNILEDSLETLLRAAENSPFRERSALPALCFGCSYQSFCGGGCKRMRAAVMCSGNDTFCGYQAFLNSTGKDLRQIARQQRLSC